MKSLRSKIYESSLSRLWSHNIEYECCALTAFRSGADCGKGVKYIHSDNQKRNKSLKAKLMSNNYGVTVLKGRYPEGGKSVTEISFFVVNHNQDKGFVQKIAKYGEMFEQDSILVVPKGAINNTGENAYLYGTNHCKNNWLGYHKKEPFSKGKLGYSSKIYTSMVNGRPFIFETVEIEEAVRPASGMGIWMMHLISNREWKDIAI